MLKLGFVVLIGVQVSIRGKIYEAADRAEELGCQTMQVFSRNPRSWRKKGLKNEDIEEFKRRLKAYRIHPLIIHIPYLINLASPNEKTYSYSIQAYMEDIEEADLLGASFLVTHMGSHLGAGEDFGIERISGALNQIINNLDFKVLILLENTAGSGHWLGYSFKHHKSILDKIEKKEKIGLCFDTCHAYAAGYDLATKKGLEETLKEIDESVGLDKLKLVHINDSASSLGSRRDRHEHIGKGKIGEKGFYWILHHPRLKDLPFILETPKKTDEDDIRNLYTVRSLSK